MLMPHPHSRIVSDSIFHSTARAPRDRPGWYRSRCSRSNSEKEREGLNQSEIMEGDFWGPLRAQYSPKDHYDLTSVQWHLLPNPASMLILLHGKNFLSSNFQSKPVSREGLFFNLHFCLIYLFIKDRISWIPCWPHTCYALEDHQKSPLSSLYFRSITAGLYRAVVDLRALSLPIKHATNWATPPTLTLKHKN